MGCKAFITATDTGAGKTWLTTAAIRSLRAQHPDAIALKPVACGFDAHGHNEDIESLRAAQPGSSTDSINCYRFALPAAPSQAAVAEGVYINTSSLTAWCRQRAAQRQHCLIEGIGGLMTPITANWLVSDWIEALPEYDIWLVVGCKLGAINQTLLTLSRLRQMGRMPAHIFFNAPDTDAIRWIESTRLAVTPFIDTACQVHCLHTDSIPELPL